MKGMAFFSLIVLAIYIHLRVLGVGFYDLLLTLAGMACMYWVGMALFRSGWAGLCGSYFFMLSMVTVTKYGAVDTYMISLIPFVCLSLGQGMMLGFRWLSRMGISWLVVWSGILLLLNLTFFAEL